MSSFRKTLEDVRNTHRAQTKNFNWFMSFLWGTVGFINLVIAIVIFQICFINPFWFREKLWRFTINRLPVKLCAFRKSLFQNYTDKVNLFDTLKNVK